LNRHLLKAALPAPVRALLRRRAHRFYLWFIGLLVLLAPRQVYRFVPARRLPAGAQRIPRAADPLDEFALVASPSSPLPAMEHANIVMRGLSFDRRQVDALPGPTFLVNWPEPVSRPNVTYVTGDQNDLRAFIDKGMLPVLYVQIIYFDAAGHPQNHRLRPDLVKVFDDPANKHVQIRHKSNMKNTPLGSALCAIAALGPTTKTIDLYGWDHYQPHSLENLSQWQMLARLVTPPGERVPFDLVECNLWSWHYAYRLANEARIRNHGYLGSLVKQSRFMERVGKIFYRP